jgi:hypothetical protein
VNIESLGEEWSGGRVIRRAPRPLRGFWKDVALAIEAGAKSEVEIASRLRRNDADVARATYHMLKHGLLERGDGGRLLLPRRVKRQLVAERAL